MRKIKKRRGEKRKNKINRMAKTEEKKYAVGPVIRSPVSASWALRTKNLGPAGLLGKVFSDFHHSCAL